jgi:hypothetical protein
MAVMAKGWRRRWCAQIRALAPISRAKRPLLEIKLQFKAKFIMQTEVH